MLAYFCFKNIWNCLNIEKNNCSNSNYLKVRINRYMAHYIRLPFVIVITLCLPSCLGQKPAKGSFGLRVKLSPVYHTRLRFHIVTLIAESQSKKAANTNFCSLWFDPTGNCTQVYRFRSRRSIHSATDRLIHYDSFFFGVLIHSDQNSLFSSTVHHIKAIAKLSERILAFYKK